MNVAADFKELMQNLAINNAETISTRYGEITAVLNKEYRDTESKKENSLQVGSYGRSTAIKGVSDLDMLYIMPAKRWETYKDGKQSQLLTEVKDAIKRRYPKTTFSVSRCVVQVFYQNFQIEVQPVFEQEDGNFKYPDTYNGGSWKITKPRDELHAISEMDKQKNCNLRSLCKIARAWKNKHGLAIGGLLIDTLVYNFLNFTEEYDQKSYFYYDHMCRDFFEFLSKLPDQDYYAALGSGQHVKVKQKFQKKAKKAYDLAVEAIESDNNSKWQKIFGSAFPSPKVLQEAAHFSAYTFKNTEEFIEEKFPIDIRNIISIDCEVSQNGFRERLLREMLHLKLPLRPKKELKFRVVQCDIDSKSKFDLYWKVLNRGDEACRRDCIRGQIIQNQAGPILTERTSFRGEHIVECYAVKNGVVIATDRIHVPIIQDATGI